MDKSRGIRTIEFGTIEFNPLPDFPGVGTDLNIDAQGNPTGPNPAHDRVLYEYTASNLASSVFSGNKREVMRIHEFRRGHDIDDMAFDADGYDHGVGVSVNGAFVYRGTQIPELTGKVIFADFLGAGGLGARLF